MAAMQGMISKPKLTVNEERTRLCLLPEESFDPPPRLYDGQEPTLTLCLGAESRTEAYPGKTKTTGRAPDQRTESRAKARSAHSGPSGAGSTGTLPLDLCGQRVTFARVGPTTPKQFLRSTSRVLTWQFIYTPTES
jgi:hypothetical protein